MLAVHLLAGRRVCRFCWLEATRRDYLELFARSEGVGDLLWRLLAWLGVRWHGCGCDRRRRWLNYICNLGAKTW